MASRGAAHAAFDPFWKRQIMTRPMAYARLARELGISGDDCHIALFDGQMCDRVIEICRGWLDAERRQHMGAA